MAIQSMEHSLFEEAARDIKRKVPVHGSKASRALDDDSLRRFRISLSFERSNKYSTVEEVCCSAAQLGQG
ncbi:hypothetical protein A9Z42_0058780 [Trichoderma parareesei]|uniref:Uncharacterized protein n=1 Tax=Trichoderma parareesei TaxID=858221 RepID=A0A2H2ZHI1_TRIPA|nr:hypothetical protein A9Z42_0058780 [Trichoderma parareesei]